MAQLRSPQFQAHLEEILESRENLAFPNVKEITDPEEALRVLSGGFVDMMTVYGLLISNVSGKRAYNVKLFLRGGGMASKFDGSGVFLFHDGKGPRVFTFAMCEHDWDESGANHSRGWHPKRCRKCGFDASIDSSD